MTVLERLKLDLNNRSYFSDTEYAVFLSENSLNTTDNYVKSDMQSELIQTEIDIFNSLANDTDIMQKLENTDFGSVSEAYKYVDDRINKLKIRLQDIQEAENKAYDDSPFFLMFTRN